MKLKFHPTHPILNQDHVGSSMWWEQIKDIQNPLITDQDNHIQCHFIYRKKSSDHHVLIDIYSQTPSVYEQWNLFHCIENTDVCVYEIALPRDWFGSYVIVETAEHPPSTTIAAERRAWWAQQLQQCAQVDPYNAYPSYKGQIAAVIHQMYAVDEFPTLSKSNSLNRYQSKSWHSEILNTCYQIDIYTTEDHKSLQETPFDLPLILFLDGQLWSQQSALHTKLAQHTLLHRIKPAIYVLIHSAFERRQHDYGCHDQFSHAVVNELIPWLQQWQANIDLNQVCLIGQSLGGLCAIHSSILYPNTFQHVVAQSGAYWWSDLTHSPFLQSQRDAYHSAAHKPSIGTKTTSTSDVQTTPDFNHLIQPHLAAYSTSTQFHMSAGQCESDMYELSQQLDLQFKHHGIHSNFHPFYGGHDPVHWHHDLLNTLQHILA